MIKSEFIIREPNISWFNRILFAFIFSGFFTLVVFLFSNSRLASEDILNVIKHLIILFFILIIFFIHLVIRHYIHINFTKFKIQHSYSIGFFKYNEKWQNLIDLKYVSIFHTSNGYEINLWYKKNRTLNLAVLKDYNEAIKKGYFFSEKLNIKLLDARKRGEHRWIDKHVYKETGKIVYSN